MPELSAFRTKNNCYTTKLETPDNFHAYKEFKKFVQRQCRSAHNSYLANSLNNHKGSKHLWSYIKSKKKDQIGVASIQYNDQFFTDDQDKANVLNQYFSSVFTVEDASRTQVDAANEFPRMQPISINPAGFFFFFFFQLLFNQGGNISQSCFSVAPWCCKPSFRS